MKINQIDSWKILTDEQMKILLENSSICATEKDELRRIIERCNAFIVTEDKQVIDSGIPF